MARFVQLLVGWIVAFFVTGFGLVAAAMGSTGSGTGMFPFVAAVLVGVVIAIVHLGVVMLAMTTVLDHPSRSLRPIYAATVVGIGLTLLVLTLLVLPLISGVFRSGVLSQSTIPEGVLMLIVLSSPLLSGWVSVAQGRLCRQAVLGE